MIGVDPNALAAGLQRQYDERAYSEPRSALRDRLAEAAMHAAITGNMQFYVIGDGTVAQARARFAYDQADAMLAEREKGK